MKQTVYIETSIPCFYYEIRPEPEMVARKEWTRQWWERYSHNYFMVTSEVVLDELNNADYPKKNQVMELVKTIPLIPVELPVTEIVQTYVKHKVMPQEPLGDALHLALASYHKCDFLLTWNCNHLANANKFNHIRRINTMLGLFVPALVTPLQLLGGKQIYEG
jgi:predicted nucleic acid-binding protein